MAFIPGTDASFGLVLLIIGLFLLWTFAVPAWAFPAIQRAQRTWLVRRRGMDERNAKRVVDSYYLKYKIGWIAGYFGVAWFVVFYFDLTESKIIRALGGFIFLALIGVIQWLGHSSLGESFTSGVETSIMKAFNEGDWVAFYDPKYLNKDAIIEGLVISKELHDSKIRKVDGEVTTIANKVLNTMVMDNYDYGRFHYFSIEVSVPPNERHKDVADETIDSIKLLNSSFVITELNDDEIEWWNDEVKERFSKLPFPEAKVAKEIFAVYKPGKVIVKVPVRNHLDGLNFEQQFINSFSTPRLTTKRKVEQIE